LEKKIGDFHLKVEKGSFRSSQITVLLGENGSGKTTFMKILAGHDQEFKDKIPEMNISYKPQTITPKFQGTVQQLLETKISVSFNDPAFITDVLKPLRINALLDKQVLNLSGK
jgi:ATP-binding cassette subfamily E protein 1